MKTKLLIALALLAPGGLAIVAPPEAGAPTPKKIGGRVYVVPGDFLVKLRSGHVAFVGVGLLLGRGEDLGVEGFDTGDDFVHLPQGPAGRRREERVRAVITDVLEQQTVRRLRSPRARAVVHREIRRALSSKAHVAAEDVFFTDVALR